MSEDRARLPGFWRTVRILLSSARKRSAGRRQRQQELLHSRSSSDWSSLGFLFAVLFAIGLNIAAAFVVKSAVESGQRVDLERSGKIIVSRHFLDQLNTAARYSSTPDSADEYLDRSYAREADNIAERYGDNRSAIEQRLRDAVRNGRSSDFVSRDDATPGLNALARTGSVPAMLGSLALLLWTLMLVTQGEGLELDIQRRRHPMWEWLFSHPVQSGAVFFAEMLSPIAANPIYWGAPLFVFALYCFVYDPLLALLAGLLIGVPLTVAAACLGKAFEIGIILRFSSRSRGAMIGLMSWFGYASSIFFFLGLFFVPKAVTALAGILVLFAAPLWPWLRLFLGGQSDGSFSLLAALPACWLATALVIACSVRLSIWGAQQGLSGNFASDSRPATSKSKTGHFGREPLYRKEFLWFIRDRSAIVQTILIPLTIAGVQIFNLRGLLARAQGTWNYLCGAAILFGTYFLWVLGPKSLSSEGTALWIALTWPRGLESLLKAKAWLWSLISTAMVTLVLVYAAFQFPGEIWKIVLVGVGWFFFGSSMSEKTVTLVAITSSSGEQEQIPWGRRLAAQLGMLTFAIGIIGQQWHLAIMGIVYSYITAAAMWQNFRARLPYLYDPWSEKVPPPPTLMHAMVAISIMIEAAAMVTAFALAFADRENVATAQAIGYGVGAVLVSFGVWHFLDGRGVPNHEIWRWPSAAPQSLEKAPQPPKHFALKSMLPYLQGAGSGLVLATIALGYLAVLRHIPFTADILRKSQEQMAHVPGLKISLAVMAVCFAPFAEEYLFRGLLFRALDREWGGWRAVVGSAAFFAIYHPALSWFPVALLGAANALLFKKSGRLGPAVALHMVYNAVVIAFS